MTDDPRKIEQWFERNVVETIAMTKELVDEFGDRIVTRSDKISTWLVVGNAGALVVLFQAVAQVSCPVDVRPVAIMFEMGLGIAFLAVTLQNAHMIFARQLFAKILNNQRRARAAQQRYAEFPTAESFADLANIPPETDQLLRKARRLDKANEAIAGFITAVMIGSVFCFGVGMNLAIARFAIGSQVCARGEPLAPISPMQPPSAAAPPHRSTQ